MGRILIKSGPNFISKVVPVYMVRFTLSEFTGIAYYKTSVYCLILIISYIL